LHDRGELSADDQHTLTSASAGREELEHEMSVRLGARRTWLLQDVRTEDALAAFGVELVEPALSGLGGVPITCLDFPSAQKAAHDEGRPLVVDNTELTSFGCAAARLGADLCYEWIRCFTFSRYDLLAVSISRSSRGYAEVKDAEFLAGHVPSPACVDGLSVALRHREEQRRRANDCAQVVAYYLSCHPKVKKVIYPGIPHDESFKRAAGTMRNGFGKYVDFTLRNPAGMEALLSASPLTVRCGAGPRLLRPLDPQEGLMRMVCPAEDARGVINEAESLLARLQ
jgi:cystathionine gamma-synthase